MKTNNRLSKDNNTHEPKVRPMVKVVQYEVWVQFDYEKGKMELRWFEDTNYYYKKDRATGNTREVERPMTDTEYIEYLEKQNQELQEANNLLATDYNKLKALTDKVDLENHSLLNEGKQLYKENQELKVYKDKFGEFVALHREEYEIKLEQAQDQFLKVVESVLNQHDYNNFERTTCYCGWNSFIVFGEIQPFIQHLLQEIKSAMEKGNND